MKRINLRLLYNNLIRSFLLANAFAIPLCIVTISENLDFNSFFDQYIPNIAIVWLMVLPSSILLYQTNIINVSVTNEIVRIKYIKFLFEYNIDLWAEDLRIEIYKVGSNYVLKLFNDHFCIRQWESFEWNKSRIKEFYYRMKREGIFVATNLFK